MICVTMKEVSGGWDMQNEKSKSLHFTEEMDRLSTLLNRHAGEVCCLLYTSASQIRLGLLR